LFELAVYRSGLYRTTENLDMFLFESSSECSFYRKVTQNLQKKSYFGSKRIFTKWPLLTVELNKLQIVNWHKTSSKF